MICYWFFSCPILPLRCWWYKRYKIKMLCDYPRYNRLLLTAQCRAYLGISMFLHIFTSSFILFNSSSFPFSVVVYFPPWKLLKNSSKILKSYSIIFKTSQYFLFWKILGWGNRQPPLFLLFVCPLHSPPFHLYSHSWSCCCPALRLPRPVMEDR